MAKSKIGIPAKWNKFVRSYSINLAYWYQPKGLAITEKAVRDRLEPLKELAGKKWRTNQSTYVRTLRKQKISSAGAKTDGGGAALARMLKQVFVTLGLAWVDGDDKVEISPIGEEFLKSPSGAKILSSQALSYQFWNPCIGNKNTHSPIKLHPVPFLVRLFQIVGEAGVSRQEYILFVSKATKIGDVEAVADKIFEFRTLSCAVQTAIIKKCKNYMIGGSKRSSIYNTIELNSAYAFKMWSLSGLIEQSDVGGLQLVPSNYRGEDRGLYT